MDYRAVRPPDTALCGRESQKGFCSLSWQNDPKLLNDSSLSKSALTMPVRNCTDFSGFQNAVCRY
jgi:hypothetical protein